MTEEWGRGGSWFPDFLLSCLFFFAPLRLCVMFSSPVCILYRAVAVSLG
jgi:hypothetical protein